MRNVILAKSDWSKLFGKCHPIEDRHSKEIRDHNENQDIKNQDIIFLTSKSNHISNESLGKIGKVLHILSYFAWNLLTMKPFLWYLSIVKQFRWKKSVDIKIN